MHTVSELFIFETDTEKFYHRGLRKSYSAEKAEQLAASVCKITPDQARLDLGKLRTVGMDSTTIRAEMRRPAGRPAAPALPAHQLYADIAPLIPMKFFVDRSGMRLAYMEADNRVLRPLRVEGDHTIFDALYGDAEIWSNLKDYYDNGPHAELLQQRMGFAAFVRQMIKEHLLIDPSKRIEREPVTLSYEPDEYALNKISLPELKSGPTPMWDEFLQRLDHPELFMAWIWGLFEPTNTIRQVLWIKGHKGQDGKSVVQKVIAQFVGLEAVQGMNESNIKDRFFLGSAYSKLLITYPDCRYRHLLKDETIKQITGGDLTSIEAKGVQIRSGVLRAKIFVTSNSDPLVNPESNFQVSRLLRLELKPQPNRTANFEQGLVAEKVPFLHKCRELFTKHIALGNDNIYVPSDLLTEMLQSCSSGSYLIAKNFEDMYLQYDSAANCAYNDYNRALKDYVLQANLTVEEARYMRADMAELLASRGIELKRPKEGGLVGYQGFKLRDYTPHES